MNRKMMAILTLAPDTWTKLDALAGRAGSTVDAWLSDRVEFSFGNGRRHDPSMLEREGNRERGRATAEGEADDR